MSGDVRSADPGAGVPVPRRGRLAAAEDFLLGLLVLLMALIPAVEFAGRRWFNTGIPDASDYLQHLTLWVGFIGAMAASREDRHLKIVGSIGWVPSRLRVPAVFCRTLVASTVSVLLAGAALQLVVSESPGISPAAARLPDLIRTWLEPFGLTGAGGGNPARIGNWIPVWVAESIMVAGFLVMAARFVTRAPLGGMGKAALAAATAGAASSFGARLPVTGSAFVVPGLVVVIGAALLGAPIFVLLGGAALVLFRGEGVTVASIPAETYRMVVSPILPTLPIFTLVGVLLAGGRASDRLVRFFRAFFGPVPGGEAVAATLLCAFFTTFTGASGVTILAMGSLLFPVLVRSGLSERFSLGLMTATGSLGLLLPPSLVVILYGVIAHVPINDMFKAALVPGTLLVVPVAAVCVIQGLRTGAGRVAFDPREAAAALWGAKWLAIMPAVALALIFGGFVTLVQASALLAVYALAVLLLSGDLRMRDLFPLLARCGTLVGAVLVILGVAMGLTSYLVDAQIPMKGAAWVEAHLHSRWIFLLALNGFLIVVGCLMDIYSALVVVVPLIIPMSAAFAIDPAHLGVIFLANLELGYLTPPVGLDLFLASLAFDRPLAQVSRNAFPFLLLLAAVVLLITYVPWLSVGVLALLK